MQIPEPYSNALLKAARQTGNETWYFQDGLLGDDDIFLASYPRSGSHFARFILLSARHFVRHGAFPSDLSGMKSLPDIHSGHLEFAGGPPRILKTHFPRDPRYRDIIHLVRDPRDVVISYYHYSKGLPHLFWEPVKADYTLPKFIDLFLRGKVWPGAIDKHSASYTQHPDNINYTRIHYEALLAEPQQEYPRLLSAAGIGFPAERIDALIGHTSFANMRNLHRPETARAGMVETNPVYILRHGVAGQHEQMIRDRMRKRIDSELGDYLKAFGYS